MKNVLLILIYILVAVGIPIIEIKLSLMEKFKFGLIIPIVTFLIVVATSGPNYFMLLFNKQTYPPVLFNTCIALFYLAIYGCCRLVVYYKKRHKAE